MEKELVKHKVVNDDSSQLCTKLAWAHMIKRLNNFFPCLFLGINKLHTNELYQIALDMLHCVQDTRKWMLHNAIAKHNHDSKKKGFYKYHPYYILMWVTILVIVFFI